MELLGVTSQLPTPQARQRLLERADAGFKGTHVFPSVTSIALEMQHMGAPGELPRQGHQLVQVIRTNHDHLGATLIDQRLQRVQLNLKLVVAAGLTNDVSLLTRAQN